MILARLESGEKMMKGVKASPGVAFGKAYILKAMKPDIIKASKLSKDQEYARFLAAKAASKKQLEALRLKTLEEIGKDESEVFLAHLMILDDPVMAKEIEALIKKDQVTAEFVFVEIINKYITKFEQLDNAYMRERAADLKDIAMRVVKNLLGIAVDPLALTEDVILVSYDLTPSETVSLDLNHTKGFVTEIGGETSHAAIIARTLNIPAVVGLDKNISAIKDNDFLILDGIKGQVIINPSDEEIKQYQTLSHDLKEAAHHLKKYRSLPSITKDGKRIEVSCNIAEVTDVDGVIEVNADGIGLFRSEFLYMNRRALPTEEEQYIAYKTVLEKMNNKPVIIRTMDIGGDKKLDYLNLQTELNPFLGYRAIRICLEDTDLFKTQLRALLRASVHGHLKMMFPMIAGLEEVLQAKEILQEVKVALKKEKIAYKQDVQIGIMIEIPSAALIADILAKEVDFFSIGTNDLIQYTTAVDRMNPKVAKLYTAYSPAFIRILKFAIDGAKNNGIKVGMCGNVAGDPNFMPLLLEMGLDEFSMSPNLVLKAKSILTSYENKGQLLERVLRCKTSKEVEGVLKNKAPF